MEAGRILEAVRTRVGGYVDDTFPITIAIGDPKRLLLGISIQHSYPLEGIERSYGIPFGRLRHRASAVISDPDELHACKWSMDVHAAVFQVDATNELRLRGNSWQTSVILSTGLGNVLQNRRSLAYFGDELHHVVGETPDSPPPYACLVAYTPESTNWERRIGIELLLFSRDGSVESINKEDYVKHPAHAVSPGQSKANVQGQIRWAVSGYPLLLGGKRVSLNGTAESASDYRHVWSLPKLQSSVTKHLAPVSSIPNANKRIEFYFGVDELRASDRFVQAINNEPTTFPLNLPVSEKWVETVCSVCEIREERLLACPAFDAKHHCLRLDPVEVRNDFKEARYTLRETEGQVQNPGDFYIDPAGKVITVQLLPAVYPHHIVGLTDVGFVVNISIAGLSGRSGITIENAKSLCQDIGLTDALIFDNGNDVVARLGYPGVTIAHKKNNRQTRLTACLHFACPLELGASGIPMDGIDIACGGFSVSAR